MSVESNKTLGGIGAILLAIPFLNLIGIILVLIAMKGMADTYNDDDIFTHTLYGFIFGVIGVIALIAVILMFVFGFTVITPIVTPWAGFGLFIIAFVVLYVFSLIAAIFYKKALDNLASRSGESMFNTAGILLLIGAIIPIIGEILKFIAWILAAVGFFSIKSGPLIPPPAPSPTGGEKQFCTYCGAPLQADTNFCPKCGKKI